tara:strand:- start:178 stop:324 length:147 start_codon:yes stop_codon:yes gene_type:complete
MLLFDKTNHTDNIEAVKKYISCSPIELKRKLEKENIFYIEKSVKMVSI